MLKHIVFQLCDVLRFDSTVVINILINKSYPKLNNQFFFISNHSEDECIPGLTSTPMAELFCQLQTQKICRSK